MQTGVGWILDVSQDQDSGEIILTIKLQDGKVISFKQKLHEYVFYIHPKSHSAGEDLFQQLSRQDHLIKRIFWEEKFTDLLNKNKTRLIGISLMDIHSVDRHDYKKLSQILDHDSRVNALYNIELSELMQFIFTQLKIPPTSKVKIEYDADKLLSIARINDNEELAPPPFSTLYMKVFSDGATDDNDMNESTKLAVRSDNQDSTFVFSGLSDPSFVSFIAENNPDIVVFCGDYRKYSSILTSEDSIFTRQSSQTVIIHSPETIRDIHVLELIEKARFSFLPLKLASKYGMMRLIDSRITYELLQRNFVIPRKKSISTHHEKIRTLEEIVDMDKAGMIISPEIGLHENVCCS